MIQTNLARLELHIFGSLEAMFEEIERTLAKNMK